MNQSLLSADHDHRSSLPDHRRRNPHALLLIAYSLPELKAVNLCEMLSVLSSVYISALCFDQAR